MQSRGCLVLLRPFRNSYMGCRSHYSGKTLSSKIIWCAFVYLLLSGIVVPLWGCGSTHGMNTLNTPLAIAEQPANASTPLGQTATFSVRAVGTGTLSYQWSKNEIVIPGAINSSYTTPAVAVSDSGEIFSVIVKDSTATITSNQAKLTVGPRSPAAEDLRFQQVDAASTASISGWGSSLILWYPDGMHYPNGTGTPLRIGAGQCVPGIKQDCGWRYATWALPAGISLSVTYWPDVLEKLDADLSSKNTPNTVVTSLDIEASNDVYGMSIMQGTTGGFDYSHEVSPLSGVQSLIAQDGAKGRVVTAISFDDSSGEVNMLSYGWASDKTTVYETSVIPATYDNIGAAATTLANEGYIITAFGGNDTDGYLLVGTRVQGDSIPRPILVSPDASISIQGYARVGWATNDLPLSNIPPVWLFEK